MDTQTEAVKLVTYLKWTEWCKVTDWPNKDMKSCYWCLVDQWPLASWHEIVCLTAVRTSLCEYSKADHIRIILYTVPYHHMLCRGSFQYLGRRAILGFPADRKCTAVQDYGLDPTTNPNPNPDKTSTYRARQNTASAARTALAANNHINANPNPNLSPNICPRI